MRRTNAVGGFAAEPPGSVQGLRLPAHPERRAELALGAAAFLFGTTFIVMKDAVRDVEPSRFLALRFALAAATLAPLAVRRGRPAPGLWKAGASAGLALAAGYVLQTTGLQYTSTSVSAFITYLLVVFVPLIGLVVLRRRPPRATVAGIAVAVVGLALLTGAGRGGGFGRGELLTVGCAFAFAAHIVVLSEVAGRHDTIQLNTVQFALVAALLVGPAVVQHGGGLTAQVWLAAAYTGVVVTALAFGFQVYGQRHVSPSRAALVLMLEPVFAGVLGYLVGDRLGWGGAVGALLILGGIALSEARASP